CGSWLGISRWNRRGHSRTPDQEPQDYRQLSNLENPRDLTDRLPIGRKEYCCEGIGHVAAAGNEEQVADETRNETRSNDQNSGRKQPKPPKDLCDENSLVAQTKE